MIMEKRRGAENLKKKERKRKIYEKYIKKYNLKFKI